MSEDRIQNAEKQKIQDTELQKNNNSELNSTLVTHHSSLYVVGVRFKQCGKIYPFEVNGVDVSPGMWVVAESEMGVSLGLVVKARHSIEKPEQQVKKLLRVATEEDLEADKNNLSLEEEARAFCIEKVKSNNLPMKIVATEATLDRKRLIFYFTADGRIDFRELVRDLASKFKTRIEMRQIGVRDEVKFIGGIGACGRQTCCTLFLTSFEPVSIRMAKKQELILNPSKLSGICGRLMCCLGYEYKQPIDAEGEVSQEVTLEEPLEAKYLEEEPMLIVEALEAKYLEEDTASQHFGTESRSTGTPSADHDKDTEYRIHDTEDTLRPTVDQSTELPGLTPQSRAGQTHVSETKQSEIHFKLERGEKGKPFSRRKSFWKKKKR